MKRTIIAILFFSITATGQKVEQVHLINPVISAEAAFQKGEYLKYRVHYGLIDAGYAELEVADKFMKDNQEIYHMKGFGRSTGLVEWTFKTRDYYDTYYNIDKNVPIEFIRDVDEGGYKTKRHIYFDHSNGTAQDLEFKKDSLFKIESSVQDLFSAFYYARQIDASELKKGDLIPIDIFLDHEDFAMQLKYLGKEYVKTNFGKIQCLKFRPMVQDGRVFRDEDSVELWISDDENKIPIKVKSKIFVGSIKMELVDYKNLAHKIDFK